MFHGFGRGIYHISSFGFNFWFLLANNFGKKVNEAEEKLVLELIDEIEKLCITKWHEIFMRIDLQNSNKEK